MGTRWVEDEEDVALMELLRLNIQANVEFDLGLLYSPQEIERVAVSLSAPSFKAAENKKLQVRVVVVVEAS